MSSPAAVNDVDHAVELTVRDSPVAEDLASSGSEEIRPLLTQPPERPKINIFSVSYSRRKPREAVIKAVETEISPFTQIISWIWNGSRYSGLLCMALSSTIYFIMELVSHLFTAQSIPLFQTAFIRCTILSVLSYLWLRRTGQPIFAATYPRKILVLRALAGFFSLVTFIYCIQRLPISQAIVLSFTTPIMASIMARFILHEKLKIADLGGLACSFFGVLFIFNQMLSAPAVAEGLHTAGDGSNINSSKTSHIYAVLVGLLSSVTGGISYCLIKAAAQASEQPMITVFSFGILASPAAAVCTLAFEDLVLPSIYTFILMLLLAVLSFLSEVFLARGFQLEKTSKVANVQYMEVGLSQLWGMGVLGSIAPSFGRLIGCLLIIISVCSTFYTGPENKDVDLSLP